MSSMYGLITFTSPTISTRSSLTAALDLLTGHHRIVERHRSREFVEFLKTLAASYPPGVTIRVILDNHATHVSKETRAYLASVPNRFEFIFTPKHGSWLNLVENLFAKLAKSVLQGIRAQSKKEMRARITHYIDDLNEEPVVFHWKYKLNTISVT